MSDLFAFEECHCHGGVYIPFSRKLGRYLDWRKIHKGKAPLLPPDGAAIIGGRFAEDQVRLTFTELPGGSYIVEMFALKSMDFHVEDVYNVFELEDVVEALYHKINTVLARIEELGIEHDGEYHGTDPYYLMRLTGRKAGMYPWSMPVEDSQIRFGLTEEY